MPGFLSVKKGDDEYPQRLLGCSDAPEVIHVDGTLMASDFSVAIVGARAASHQGMRMAKSLAATVVENQGRVVSGGALGIDGAAHRGALAAGGSTWVVQGCGLNHCYPLRHRSMFEKVIAKGARISAFDHDAPPKGWHFVARNRLIAGLADVVIVVEARRASGSMHTASFATRYHRQLLAVPGTTGCDVLIAKGHALALESEDLMSLLRGEFAPSTKMAVPNEDSLEGRLLRLFQGNRSMTAMEISTRSGESIGSVLASLTALELDRWVERLPCGAFVASAIAFEPGLQAESST